WSCPYDSIIVILHNLWKDHKVDFHSHLMSTPYLNQLLQGFTNIDNGINTLEDVCNELCLCLHQNHEDLFPQGQIGAEIHAVCEMIFTQLQGRARTTWVGTTCQVAYHIQDQNQMVQDVHCQTALKLKKIYKDSNVHSLADT
ncbi:hypothetical protein K439DRAFT_1369364, partial [Ramaria rubella]